MRIDSESSVIGPAEFQMSLLLFMALAGYLIAYGINQSAVVGIILVGIIVSPSLMGLVTYTDFVPVQHLGAVPRLTSNTLRTLSSDKVTFNFTY
jgi:hypothetical protein